MPCRVLPRAASEGLPAVAPGRTVDCSVPLPIYPMLQPSRAGSLGSYRKPSLRGVAVRIDCLGLATPNEFRVGYGRDRGEQIRRSPDTRMLRNLPDSAKS